MIDAPHENAQNWFICSKQFDFLVFDAKVFLLNHSWYG